MKSFLQCLLHCGYEVKHLAISTEKHPFNETNYPEELRSKIMPQSAFADTCIKPFHALKYLFNKRSYNIDRFLSDKVLNLINQTLVEATYDIVILDSLYCTPYLNQIRQLHDGKIFVRTHNVESEIWFDLALNSGNPLKKWYLSKLARDLKQYELEILNKVDGILTLSIDDLYYFQNYLINKKIVNVPVHMELPADFSYSPDSAKIFHLGSYDWQPNTEAVNKLLEIWPEIRKKHPEASLSIAGKHGDQLFKSNESQGIHVNGFIDNLSAFLSDKSFLISPILSGSGVRIKILEMMAYGFPVITTTRGAQGMDSCAGVCIANTDEELVSLTTEMLQNTEKRRFCSTENRSYIEQKHDIRIISKTIEGFISK